jgi:glycosyltransferase involved in cell wall biosynthesis
MSLLAQSHRVLYIDYQYTWKDMLVNIFLKKKVPVKRMLGVEKRLRKIVTQYDTTLYVYTPLPVFPINWISIPVIYNTALRINNFIIEKSIKKAINTLKIRNPLVINALNPFYGLYNVNKFNEIMRIYYCYDEIDAAHWIGKHGKKIEEKYIPQVDIVITSSEELRKEKNKYAKQCFTVNNGVDFKRFNQIVLNKNKSNQNKIVGYIGSIDERLDYALLEYVVSHSPDVTFKFIGRITQPGLIESLRRYENAIFTGPVPYLELPQKIGEFDVCLIPFRKNKFTSNIYPLKINEYLAAGKPVVMTDFASLHEFEGVVSICENYPLFLRAIHEEIDSNSIQKENLRIKTAATNSWEQKAREFDTIISSELRALSITYDQAKNH